MWAGPLMGHNWDILWMDPQSGEHMAWSRGVRLPSITTGGKAAHKRRRLCSVQYSKGQYVLFAHWMLCCTVGYVERGGLTSRDRLNRSENYLLLGFLLVMQSVLLEVRQSATHDNCSVSVSYPSSSKVKGWKNLVTLEAIRVDLNQETIQSWKEVLPFFVNYEAWWRPSKKSNQTNEHHKLNLRAAESRFSHLLSASHRMNTS